MPTCLVLSLPFTYIWLHVLSPVDAAHLVAYRFGCLAIAFSCVAEMTAEAPVYVAQVFCFVKIKIVLDTLHIFVRSLVFITLVMSNANSAIYAFGIAQMSSAATIIVGNYLFFHVYIRRLRAYRKVVRGADGVSDAVRAKFGKAYEHMDDFPFESVLDMVPGVLPNEVSHFHLIFLQINVWKRH